MSDPTDSAARAQPRVIGARTATLLVVASMVGTGVFTTSGFLLRDLRSGPAVLLVWTVGGLLAMAGALSYAELVAALPQNGGEYHLLGTIYHPAVGFVAGFVSFVVGFSAAIAVSAFAFGEYMEKIVPGLPKMGAAVFLVAAMCLVQLARVQLGSKVQDALTILKIGLILVFLAAAVFGVDATRAAASERGLFASALSPQFAVGLVFVTFSYSGWNAATYIAGEVETPSRTLPLALVAGTALVTVFYVAVNFVFLASAPATDLVAAEEAVGHVAAVHLLGPRAGVALSAVIALGLISTVGALVMTGARVLDAMGRDHGLLAILARRASDRGPALPVLALGGLAIALLLTSSFEALLDYVGFTLSLSAGLTVLGVIVLRLRRPGLERPYRAWGYPITPLAFVGTMIWMIAHSIRETPLVAAAGAGTIAVGGLLYLVVRRASPR